MKKFTLLFAVVLIALFTWNCEKDDICEETTSTTPRLILHFYDAANPTIEKNVTTLAAIGVGSTEDPLTWSAVPQIELPLKTTEDSTSYSLILNSTNAALANEALITFNYTRTEVYVSRACGYKAVFTLDPVTPFVLTDGTPENNLWIQDISVTQPNVQNENETHISVYF